MNKEHTLEYLRAQQDYFLRASEREATMAAMFPASSWATDMHKSAADKRIVAGYYELAIKALMEQK